MIVLLPTTEASNTIKESTSFHYTFNLLAPCFCSELSSHLAKHTDGIRITPGGHVTSTNYTTTS